MKRLLLISGPVAVGKSGIATALLQNHNFNSLKSSAYLRDIARKRGIEESRTNLQQLGDELDEQTDYQWVVDKVSEPQFAARPEVDNWLFDSVRKAKQIEHFRRHYSPPVLHVHLTAKEQTLKQRYQARLSVGTELGNVSYETAIAHPNETSSRKLIEIADLVVELENITSEVAAQTILKKWIERKSDAQNRSN